MITKKEHRNMEFESFVHIITTYTAYFLLRIVVLGNG